MNSGIYQYTFANGDNYVGQAINIQTRWDQHISKMQKGKHTKLIQDAYNKYGEPRFNVIIQCHPHYLDALEALYIYILKPELNTTIPATYMTKDLDLKFDQDIITRNLYDNIMELQRLRDSEEDSEELIAELEHEIKRLEKRVLLVATEKQPKELQDYLHTLQTDADFLSTQLKIAESARGRLSFEIRELKEKIYQYNKLPWYKRIFQTV